MFLILAKCWPCGDSCKSAESSMQDSLNVARETEFNLSATNTCSKCCIHSSMQAKLTIWQLCTTPNIENCAKINLPLVEQIGHIGTVVFSSDRSSLHYDTPLSSFLLSRCNRVKPVNKSQWNYSQCRQVMRHINKQSMQKNLRKTWKCMAAKKYECS